MSLGILLIFSEDIHRAGFLAENLLKKRILGKILNEIKSISWSFIENTQP